MGVGTPILQTGVGHPRPADNGLLQPGQDGGTPPPPNWLDGGTSNPFHSQYLLRGRRYASCVQAGAHSCYHPHPKDGGRYCFQFVCQFTPRLGGGGRMHPRSGQGVPHSRLEGVLWGTPPGQVWMVRLTQSTPQPGLDGGGTQGTLPARSGWWGYPGYSPAKSGFWVVPGIPPPQPGLDGGVYPGYPPWPSLDGGGGTQGTPWPGLDGGAQGTPSSQVWIVGVTPLARSRWLGYPGYPLARSGWWGEPPCQV